MRAGICSITAETAIVYDDAAAFAARFLANVLRDAARPVAEVSQASALRDKAGSTIRLSVHTAREDLGPEGYRLDIDRREIVVESCTPAGVFYGVQTLLQMLPVDVYDNSKSGVRSWGVPCATIEDAPRFGWRGVMLDVSRHFMPLPFLRKFVDLLAVHKMNVLHLHLTDDQGWRMEIKKYPRLTQVGAYRKETLVGHLDSNREMPEYDGVPHGGFYTQEELRELVSYAADRNVTIVPEIEMPGHAQAAIAAYPELGVSGEPLEVCSTWGIIEHIFNPFERTLEFLRDVLVEVMEIFPSRFIHVGGDEAVKHQWKASPAVQERIRELGLKDEAEMQSYIVGQMSEFLAKHGRRLIGWDEIIEGGLAENAAVMSWRGESGGITAASSGHDVVMAPVGFTYLDLYQTDDRGGEPVAQGGYLPLDRVYGYEPVPQELAPDRARHVLGTQAQLWTEYMPTPEHVEYMAFPRLCALAEVAWSEQCRREYTDFASRLIRHLGRLDALQVNYRSFAIK